MKKVTRRDVLAGGAAAIASTALGQSEPGKDAAVERVKKQLAQPISAEAEKILASSIRSNDGASNARLRFKLPENSEPCFVFPVTPTPPRRAK